MRLDESSQSLTDPGVEPVSIENESGVKSVQQEQVSVGSALKEPRRE